MNFRAEGGGVPMAPGADAQDGKLSVCMAWGIPKWRTFLCLPLLVTAIHLRIRGFEVTNCKEYDLKLKTPMVLHGRRRVLWGCHRDALSMSAQKTACDVVIE